MRNKWIKITSDKLISKIFKRKSRFTKLLRNMLLISAFSSVGVLANDQSSMQLDANAENSQQIQDTLVSARFGQWLFTGGFKEQTFSAVNPLYKISQGDQLLVQLWGGVDFQQQMTVDPQGNIFIPKVGPVRVSGVSNAKLNNLVTRSIKRVYKSNVSAYVSLVSNQQVKVFLSGMVNNPGLYVGQSADSILRFLDLAGGIRNDIGSYRGVQVKRNNKVMHTVDLYSYLLHGKMPALQLQDGDVIFVAAKKGEVTVSGEVGFEGAFELDQTTMNLTDLLHAAVANEQATHVTVISPLPKKRLVKNKQISAESNSTPLANRIVEATQYDINDTDKIELVGGSVVKVTSQVRANSISVSLLGEHQSAQEMVLPWGASLGDLLAQVQMTRLSNTDAVQLFRESVAQRQFTMLQASLNNLEQTVLTARSNSREAAELRKAEANIILQWVAKARQVKPKGQVLLIAGTNPNDIILQQGDKVVVPAKKNLVMVHGEVRFPTAIAYNTGFSVTDFINKAGGTADDLDEFNILIMQPNGSFISANELLSKNKYINPGDEIFVLAKPDFKGFQLTKDITEIIYQVAMSAAVVIAL
jgi:protein involved in polysaccharide export with SLBB domain